MESKSPDDTNLTDLAELAEKFETRGEPTRVAFVNKSVIEQHFENWSSYPVKARFTMRKSRVKFVK